MKGLESFSHSVLQTNSPTKAPSTSFQTPPLRPKPNRTITKVDFFQEDFFLKYEGSGLVFSKCFQHQIIHKSSKYLFYKFFRFFRYRFVRNRFFRNRFVRYRFFRNRFFRYRFFSFRVLADVLKAKGECQHNPGFSDTDFLSVLFSCFFLCLSLGLPSRSKTPKKTRETFPQGELPPVAKQDQPPVGNVLYVFFLFVFFLIFSSRFSHSFHLLRGNVEKWCASLLGHDGCQ